MLAYSCLTAKLAIIAAFGWVSLCTLFRAISCGLDGSWQFGVNALSSHGLHYGEDILFTYGPLGHLLMPLPINANILHALIAQLGILSMLCMILVYASFRWLSLSRLLIIGMLWFFVTPNPEIQPVLVVVMLASLVAAGSQREALVCIIPASLIAIAAFFAKFSLGFATLGAILAALIIRSCTDPKDARNIWLLAMLTFLVCTAATTYWGFGSVEALLHWIRGGIEISDGYSSAMSIGGAKKELVLALIALAAFVVLIILNFIDCPKKDRYLMLVIIAPMFLFFKHGFVRQDSGHILTFFGGYALLLCSLAIVGRSKRAFRRFAFLGCLGTLIYLPVAHTHGKGTTCERLLGQRSLAISRQISNFKASHSNVVSRSEGNLMAEKIDEPSLESIITAKTSFDIIPYDTSIIQANGYRWQPAPVFQHYSAYTEFLDKENARHYASTNGADILLCRFQAVDGRHMLWDTPLTWHSQPN